jgi:hypothetical protein
MKILLTFILFLLSLTGKSQTCIVYFEAERKGDVNFTWQIKSDEKELTYLIQCSNDKLNFTDMYKYKTEHRTINVSLFSDYTYFRLKIMINKDCYIYSDILYLKNDQPIQICPDVTGAHIVYITSKEEGTCYIYNKSNTQFLSYSITEGYNQIYYHLPNDEYTVKVFTENFVQQIKIFVK